MENEDLKKVTEHIIKFLQPQAKVTLMIKHLISILIEDYSERMAKLTGEDKNKIEQDIHKKAEEKYRQQGNDENNRRAFGN